VSAQDDEESFVNALEEILEILKRALNREPLDRHAYIVALAALAQFITPAVGVKTATRLLYLVAALSDLEQGARPALLTPVSVENRPPISSLDWAIRAHAALALECHKRCGDNLDHEARRLALGREFTDGALKNWRVELINERVKNALAQITWSNGLVEIENLGQEVPQLRQVAKMHIESSDSLRAAFPKPV
jgi:hypothetical protein